MTEAGYPSRSVLKISQHADPTPTRTCARHGCREVSLWQAVLDLRRRDGRPEHPMRIATPFGICETHRQELAASPTDVFPRADWRALAVYLSGHGRDLRDYVVVLDPVSMGAEA